MGMKALFAVSVLLLCGCASGPATRSGYLGDYSEMRQVDDSDSVLIQPPPADFDVSRYRAVKIDEPEIVVSELGADERAQLCAVFKQALVDEFTGGMPLAESTGPGILHVRSAVTSVSKANVALNVVTTLVIAPVSRGGAAAEAEVVDGGTGERIAALSWSRRGAKLRRVTLPYTRLGEARAALQAFADRLAGLLEAGAADPQDAAAANTGK